MTTANEHREHEPVQVKKGGKIHAGERQRGGYSPLCPARQPAHVLTVIGTVTAGPVNCGRCRASFPAEVAELDARAAETARREIA